MNKIIDLTYDIEQGMISFNAPWHSKVSVHRLGTIETVGRETRKVIFGTHTGTHIDAPLHFIKKSKSIDKIPLAILMGKVAIVDFSYLKKGEPVTSGMLGKSKITERVIFKFGWSKYWNKKIFYKNYPFFKKDAVEYLISKRVKLVGMDTPSPDDSKPRLKKGFLGGKNDSPMHKMFLDNGVILIEYLANLDRINDYQNWNIIALPLKIKGADGSPARVCIYK